MRARLALRGRVLEPSPARPLLMGVVNATPDSFSDPPRAGAASDPDALVARALELSEAGADLIDVGGESGRTDRATISEAEEIHRVVEPIERLAAAGLAVSVDTWRAGVAGAALAAGAAMVNDPSGLSDPDVAEACAETGAGLVVTHTRLPPKVKGFPGYGDVVADVVAFLGERLEEALGRGVRQDQLVVDPGVDLAKSPAETTALLRGLEEVAALGRPLLLAVSRKDFLGALSGRRPRERLAGTLAAIDAGLERGASILRVHDVAEVADYLRVRAALRGELTVAPYLHLSERLRREPPAPRAAREEQAPETRAPEEAA